jgi:hypothetical protein
MLADLPNFDVDVNRPKLYLKDKTYFDLKTGRIDKLGTIDPSKDPNVQTLDRVIDTDEKDSRTAANRLCFMFRLR